MPNTPVDILSWRVIARGPKPVMTLPKAAGAGDAASARKGRRAVYLPAERRFAEVPVYDRYALAPGLRLRGPAIVEERESTVVVNGPGAITLDPWSNLIVDL